MSRLDSLPPDLHAALALLLRQRKRHGEVAALLGIEARAVHDRAHAALALLAPREARALGAAERERLGEYLLGQQTAAQEHETRIQLEDSPAARAWAQALADELAPLAAQPLPAIPLGRAPHGPPSELTGGQPAPAQIPAERHRSSHPSPAPSSRVGGAVILGVIAVAVVVAVLLIVGVGGGSSSGGGSHSGASAGSTQTTDGSTQGSSGAGASTSPNASTSTATGAATSTGAQATHGKALALTPPDSATSRAAGIAYVLAQKGQHAFYVFTKGLPPITGGAFYAVWLEGATKAPAYPLGSLPAPNASGLVEGGGPLPSDAGAYDRIVVTRETSHHPAHPGPTVLGGAFTLE